MLVSVVVPTYRRPDRLARCLASLAGQDFDPWAFEVIVADDAADESTRRQVEAAGARYVAVVGRHGPAAARNAGWRGAEGSIIAFTDDDCLPDPRWLAEGVATLGRERADAASGRIVVPVPGSPTDYERDAAGLEAAEFATANGFCRREALEAVGGFDERYAAAWREDSDLQFALLAAGRSIARAPSAVVVHPVRPAPWGVSLRQQRKGLFDALLFKKYPALYRARIGASLPRHYYASVVALAATASGLAAGSPRLALASGLAWAILTAHFCARRLRQTSKRAAHVAEMVVTSALIPPLSVFWRLYGALKFRVLFF